MKKYSKAVIACFILSVILIFSNSAALAHVSVKPAEVTASSFQTFTVGAPNEKAISFNKIELKIPEGLKHVSPIVKAGWDIDVQKDGSGDDAKVTAIIWDGNSVASGFKEEFSFSAQAPSEDSELQWKAYQTYADGKVIAWDLSEDEQPKKEDGSPDFSNSGPFSVTKVVSETETAAAIKNVERVASETSAEAKSSADRSLLVAVAAIVLAGVSLVIAAKRK